MKRLAGTPTLVLGCLLLFFARRMFAATEAATAMVWIAVGLIIVSFGLRIPKRQNVVAELRAAERTLLRFHFLSLVGLLIYGFSTAEGRELIGRPLPPPGSPDDLGLILELAWPLVVALGLLPLLMLERALAPMTLAGQVVSRRFHGVRRLALTLVMAIAAILFLNVSAHYRSMSWDLSDNRSAKPGTASQAMVRRLEQPLEVLLFFPRANDVLQKVERYFAALEGGDQIKVSLHDRLLEPELAKRHKVVQEGSVVLKSGDSSRLWQVGAKKSTARSRLKKLDAEFQKQLHKLMHAQGRTAYLVTGHGEINQRGETAPTRVRFLQEVLRRLGYDLKDLSLKNGLGRKVPDDAGLVLLLGPMEGLSEAEGRSLSKYFSEGGRLLMGWQPESKPLPQVLLKAFGLRQDPHVLMHDKLHLARRRDASDRSLIVTGAFASHPAVSTLARGQRPMGVILGAAGAIHKDAPEKNVKVSFTLRSMPDTWADSNGDGLQQKAQEKGQVHQLGAAVVHEREGSDGKALVYGDADLFADEQMGALGNRYLLIDGLNWLADEESFSGTTDQVEDLPVQHSRSEDALIFHGTVFGLPLLVLAGGLTYLRRRRRS